MLQIHKPLSRKLWIYSTIALIGIGGPALVYGMSITPEYAKAAGTTLKDITTMQEMTSQICGASMVGDSNTLKDTRDNTMYSVAKLSDGNCWMTQNIGITGKTLTSADSDVTSNYYVSNTGGWSSNTATNTTADVVNLSSSGDGAAYSWCAVTAGTCSAATSDGVDAPASVCPKGWKLPRNSEYGALADQYTGDWVRYNNKNGRWLGGDSVANGGTFFVGFGYYKNLTDPGPHVVGSGALSAPNAAGEFWTRTAAGVDRAYVLHFSSGDEFDPALDTERKFGFFARCVAYGDSTVGGSKVNVSVTPMITIDATSGMNSEVEASTVATGNITARISSNTAYKVLLSASTSNPGNKTSLYRRTDDMKEGTTPTYDTTGENIPATSTVEANQNGWGISNSCNQDGSNLAYLPITTVEKEYCGSSKESATYDEATQQYTHTFDIGISVSPSLNSGTYETSVTVTGVAN